MSSLLGSNVDAFGVRWALMRLAGRPKLTSFAADHADVRSALEAWVGEIAEAKWTTPCDIKARYPSASFLADNHVVFNLKGNKHRLEVKISFEVGTVLILNIGTHAEYSRWELQ